MWWMLATALWIQVAIGGPELEIERGRLAYELERYGDARNHAIAALQEVPSSSEAQQLYIEATTAAGLGSRGLFELVASETTSPPWFPDASALELAVADGEWKPIRDATKKIITDWPTAPDLLAPLWTAEGSKLARARQKLLSAMVSPASLAAAEVEQLYRLRRLIVEIDANTSLDVSEARALVEEALTSRGERPPPPRPPLDRLKRGELAGNIAKEPIPQLDWGYPDEIVDVGLKVEEILGLAKRWRHVALAWQQVQQHTDDATAFTREAAAWLNEGELDKAKNAVAVAFAKASSARSSDLIALNTDRQRKDLAEVLLVRARLAEKKGDIIGAYGDYATAVLLTGHTLDDAFGERLENASRLSPPLRGGRYPGAVPSEAALAAALAAKGEESALAHTADARYLAAVGTRGCHVIAEAPDLYRELFARTWEAEFASERAAGNVDAARSAILLATVLSGTAHPFWWVTRGELQEQSGELDAAFASFSVARGLGVRGLDEQLAHVYVGVADWELGANNLGGPEPEVAAVDEGSLPKPSHGTGGSKPPRERPSSAPELNKPFPSFSIDIGSGRLSNGMLSGRVYIITFWRADCSTCLKTLQDFGRLARTLRNSGRDVRVIGVSLDGDEALYEKIFQRAKAWCELAHAPELAARFAISTFPSTWVVDSQGIARRYYDHWISADNLADALTLVE